MSKGDKVEAIIVAAGKSLRAGNDKLYVLLKGKPLIFYTIEAIVPIVPSLVLVVEKERLSWWKEHNTFMIKKIIQGGKERQDSVWLGLKNLDRDSDFVLIHDGARPFVKEELIKRVIGEAYRYEAAVSGIKSSSTVKTVRNGWVVNTLKRDDVWIIQTPQCFKKEIILSCYEKAYNDGFYGTDCAQIVEKGGFKVKVVLGDEKNIKITTQFDLSLANFLVKIK